MSDCIASIFASLSQVIVGHPFDTAKVYIQNKKSLKKLTFTDYYRGYKYPLCSSIISNGILFPVYERTKVWTGSSFASGFLGGAIISPFIFVSDYYKICRQIKKKKLKNSLLMSYGKFSVFCRESVAYCVFFGVYDLMRHQYDYPAFISGSICGVCNWGITYPIDVIRSRQIAQQITIRQALQQKKLYKGLSVCLARALFVNAALFQSYELVYFMLKSF